MKFLSKNILFLSVICCLNYSYASNNQKETEDSKIIQRQDISYSEFLYQDIVVKGKRDLLSLLKEFELAQNDLHAVRDRLRSFPENPRLNSQAKNLDETVERLSRELSDQQNLLELIYVEQCQKEGVPVLHGLLPSNFQVIDNSLPYSSPVINMTASTRSVEGVSIFNFLVEDVIYKIVSHASPKSILNLSKTCSYFKIFCNNYISKNPFIIISEINPMYKGTALGKVVDGKYLICGERNGISELIIIGGIDSDILRLSGVPFGWYAFSKAIALDKNLIFPNLNGFISQFSIENIENHEILSLFPSVNSNNLGVLQSCDNGNFLAISEWEEDLENGALLLLDSNTKNRSILHQGGIDCEKPFVSLGNSQYLTMGYDGSFIWVDYRNGQVRSNQSPEHLNFQNRAGNGLGQVIFRSFDDPNAGIYSYHLGRFDTDNNNVSISNLNFDPLPEGFKYCKMFFYNNKLITVGSTISSSDLYFSNEEYRSSSIITVYNVDSGENIYSHHFLENSRFCPQVIELFNRKVFLLSRTKDDETLLSILDLKNLI